MKSRLLLIPLFILILITPALAFQNPFSKYSDVIVAYWNMEPSNATHIPDSNLRHNLTITGTINSTTEIIPGSKSARKFDGVNDALELHKFSTSFNFTNSSYNSPAGSEFTMMGWFEPYKTISTYDFIAMGVDTTTNYGYALIRGSGGNILLNIYGGAGLDTPVINGDYNQVKIFLVTTYNGTHSSIYVNNSNTFLSNTVNADGGRGFENVDDYFKIGLDSDGTGNDYNGTADEVSIWNVSLPFAGEQRSILEIYNDYIGLSRNVAINLTLNSNGISSAVSNDTDVAVTVVNLTSLKVQNNKGGYININLTGTSAIGNIRDINSSIFVGSNVGTNTNITSYLYNNTNIFFDINVNQANDFILDRSDGTFTILNSPSNLIWNGNITEWDYEHSDTYVEDSTSRSVLSLITVLFTIAVVLFAIRIVWDFKKN